MHPHETDATPGVDGPQTHSNAGTSPLAELVHQYLASRSTGRDENGNPTGSYVSSAASVIRRWADWMQTRGYSLEDLDTGRGPHLLNQYALHLDRRVGGDGITAATAERYFSYVSGCLSYGVRQGMLSSNPALTEAGREDLPVDQRNERTEQQFWSADQRRAIVGFVDERAEQAIVDAGFGAWQSVRDRALVRVLVYSGVRGAEVLRDPKDGREGRQGLRWRDVDLDAGTMRVFRKDQSWQRTPLPNRCIPALERLRTIHRPPTNDWPVFATDHAPTLHRTGRDALDEYDDVLDDHDGDVWEVLRVHELVPPALTTEGARSLMKRLTEQAGVDVDEDYLEPHGARRGLGDELYRRDRGLAQDVLGHKDLSTTQAAYQHIDAEERRERLDEQLDEID